MKYTLRSYLNKLIHRGFIVYAPMLVGIPILLGNVSSQTPAFVIFVTLTISCIYLGVSHCLLYRNFKCPKCGISLVGLYSCKKRSSLRIKIPEDVKYCPGCALSLDEPIDTL